MTPTLRKLTVATHLVSSVGWLGAVLVFLSLAVVGLTSRDEAMVRGAYFVMVPAAWFVLVPLAHTSVLSGVALSLGTAWGLFRHYWVAFKLVTTVFATVILMVYLSTFSEMAGTAADPGVDLNLVRNPSPAVHSVLALIVLCVTTWLGVYKPFGMTPYGVRKSRLNPQTVASRQTRETTAWRWSYGLGIFILGLTLFFALLHFAPHVFQH